MYREVAETPEADFHFEMGRALAERLGYAPDALDRIPAAAIDSFAGVGHFLDRAAIEAAGLAIRTFREHPEYRFLTESARGACEKWGVKSISLLAVKA